MRKGVWIEWLLVTLWAVLVREPFILFLSLSPLARSCVHLLWLDSLSVLLSSLIASSALCVWLHAPHWFLYSEIGAYVAVGLYTFVIGELNSERDKLRRELTISAFRRAERMKDEERLRIASELHDVMGQYWTAVVRALDVAMLMEGNERLQGESEGIGLKTMRDLAGSIGGTVHLHSKRGFGVTVSLIIPYPKLNATIEPLPRLESEGMFEIT
jgi:signal transduction histidine kinase